MQFEHEAHSGFAYEMMETMVSATEIFNTVLLNNLKKYFGIRNAFITVFDFDGNFLSLTDLNRIYRGKEHPYAEFSARDICAKKVIEDCRRDKMWHDNTKTYIYRASDLLSGNDEATSAYVRFLYDTVRARYMLIMPFDIDGCIHLCIYRSEQEGEYSDRELQQFEKIYTYIARTFKAFKAQEKPKIISSIKDEVILTREDAYIITDINHKILSGNGRAMEYLSKITGRVVNKDNLHEQDALVRFLLGSTSDQAVQNTVINGYAFQAHPFPVSYVHGMVETYHWITIRPAGSDPEPIHPTGDEILTKREKKVVELLCQGLSYQDIADEMYISFHTVKNHVQNIFSKYQVKSRYEFYQVYKEGKQIWLP